MFSASWRAGLFGTARRPLVVALAAATVLVLARSAVFLIWEQAGFDSDQAIFGLMAKHLAEARAFPMFLYGAQYLLAVEAWLAAPVFVVFGPSVAALKAPLVLMNVATAGLLVWVLHRDGRLSPAAALVASLFFVAAPPALASMMVDNGGGNPEPYLYVLLLWVLRGRPLAFGLLFGVGFLHREFTAYGLTAIVLLALLENPRITPERLRAVALAGAGYFIVWQLVRTGFMFSTPFGPGAPITTALGAGENLEGLAGRSCFSAATIGPGLTNLFGSYLGLAFGANDLPVADFGLRSYLRTGLPGLPPFWPILGGAFAVAAIRVAWISLRTRAPIWRGRAAVATFLLLVGLQSAVAYAVARCGALEIGTFRYILLSIYIGVGIVGLFFIYEPKRLWRWSMAGLVLVWALISGIGHLRVLDEYVNREPESPHRLLATYLLENDVRYARSDYWTAYATSFLSDERIIISSNQVVRIREYENRVAAHQKEMVTVQRQACEAPGGTEAVAGRFWLCPEKR